MKRNKMSQEWRTESRQK